MHWQNIGLTVLLSMIIWSTGQISSYHGGDAHWQVVDINFYNFNSSQKLIKRREGELGVVAWVQKNTAFKSVRTVKLQHHGSADSTPVALLRSFKPRSIIVSADTTSHGHPRAKLPFPSFLPNSFKLSHVLTNGLQALRFSCGFTCGGKPVLKVGL